MIVLKDGRALLRGEAQVITTYEIGKGPEGHAGMRIKFTQLDEPSRKVHADLLEAARAFTADKTPLLPMMPEAPRKKTSRSQTLVGLPPTPLPEAGAAAGKAPLRPDERAQSLWKKKDDPKRVDAKLDRYVSPFRVDPVKKKKEDTAPFEKRDAVKKELDVAETERSEQPPRHDAEQARAPGSPETLPANPLSEVVDEALGYFIDCTLHEETHEYNLPNMIAGDTTPSPGPAGAKGDMDGDAGTVTVPDVFQETGPVATAAKAAPSPSKKPDDDLPIFLATPSPNAAAPIFAAPPITSPLPRITAHIVRRPLPVAGGIAAAAILVGLFVGWLVFGRSGGQPAPAETAVAAEGSGPSEPTAPPTEARPAPAEPSPPTESPPSPTPARPEGTPKPNTGTLSLASTPPGAVVFIDGKKVGRAPIQVSYKRGRHVVVAAKSGYRRWTKSVVIRSDESVDVHARLVKK